MSTHDKFGRAWATHADTTEGTVVETDSDMGGCLSKGVHRTVKLAGPGQLYIDCAAGRHYLDGQRDYRDGDDVYIGLYNVTKEQHEKTVPRTTLVVRNASDG